MHYIKQHQTDLIVYIAKTLAIKAHDGQYRRDGTTPYIVHPEAVANSLEDHHPHVIAAAWLHDVLEDTNVNVAEFKLQGIPDEVIHAVVLLSKTRHTVYDEYISHIKHNDIARVVKIADIKANLKDDPTQKQIEKYTKALTILEE